MNETAGVKQEGRAAIAEQGLCPWRNKARYEW